MPGGVAFYGTENALFRVRFKGSNIWRSVPGWSSYREEGGKKPIREAIAFQGVGSKTGKPRIPEIIGNVIYAPLNQIMKDLNSAYLDGDLVDLEAYFAGDVIYSGAGGDGEIAIDADGVVTFSGVGEIPIKGNALLEPGLTIVDITVPAAEVYYPIDTITVDAGVYEVKTRPSPAEIAASISTFEVRLESFSRGPIKAEVTQSGYIEADSESNITSICSFQPRSLLPEVKRGLSA